MSNGVGLQRPLTNDSGLYRHNTYAVGRSLGDLQNYFTQWANFDDSRQNDPAQSFRIDLVYPMVNSYVNAFDATASAPTINADWDTSEILAKRVLETGINFTNEQIEQQQAGQLLARGAYDSASPAEETILMRAIGKSIVQFGNDVEKVHLRNAMATTSQIIHATGFGTATGNRTLEEIATDSLDYMGSAGPFIPRVLMIPPGMRTPLVGTRIRDYEGSPGSIRYLEGPEGFASPTQVGQTMMGLTIVTNKNVVPISYSAKTANTLTITKASTANPRIVSIGNSHTAIQTVTLGEAFTFTGEDGNTYNVILQDTVSPRGGLVTGQLDTPTQFDLAAQASGTNSSTRDFLISDPIPDAALPDFVVTTSSRTTLTPIAGNAGGTFYNCPIFVPGAYTIFRKNFQHGRVLDQINGIGASNPSSPIYNFGYQAVEAVDQMTQARSVSLAMAKFGGYMLDGQAHENASSRDPKDIYFRHNFIGTTIHRNNMARLLVPASVISSGFNQAPVLY